MRVLVAEFGDRTAEGIKPLDEHWLSSQQDWATATKDRYRALMSLVYRQFRFRGPPHPKSRIPVCLWDENSQSRRWSSTVTDCPLAVTSECRLHSSGEFRSAIFKSSGRLEINPGPSIADSNSLPNTRPQTKSWCSAADSLGVLISCLIWLIEKSRSDRNP